MEKPRARFWKSGCCQSVHLTETSRIQGVGPRECRCRNTSPVTTCSQKPCDTVIGTLAISQPLSQIFWVAYCAAGVRENSARRFETGRAGCWAYERGFNDTRIFAPQVRAALRLRKYSAVVACPPPLRQLACEGVWAFRFSVHGPRMLQY